MIPYGAIAGGVVSAVNARNAGYGRYAGGGYNGGASSGGVGDVIGGLIGLLILIGLALAIFG
jgi:hypothetical protein